MVRGSTRNVIGEALIFFLKGSRATAKKKKKKKRPRGKPPRAEIAGPSQRRRKDITKEEHDDGVLALP